jgi:hypothetical protein
VCGRLPRHRSRLAVAVALAAVVALVGVLARPSPPSLSTLVTGDAALAARARPLLPGALDRVSIAVVDGSAVTYAGLGADEHTLALLLNQASPDRLQLDNLLSQ